MADGLLVEETWVNRTENCGAGETGIYEAWMQTPGEAYREFARMYGRCTGKVYVDGNDGKPIHVGWVFLKRKKYEDTDDTYLLETWVTLHERKPETKTAHFPLSIADAAKRAAMLAE